MCQDTQTLFILKGIYKWHISPDIFQQFAAFLAIFVGQQIVWIESVNSNFFLKCKETEARFIFEGSNIVFYGKFISNSSILFSLFYLVCKVFKELFQLLCQSVNYMSWVFET